MTEFNYENEGITHINISPSSKSEIGRRLAVGYPAAFHHPLLGGFKSMQQLHIWMKYKYHTQDVKNMELDEFEAYVNTHRESFKTKARKVSGFRQIYEECLYHRIMQDPELKQLVTENDLPLVKYVGSDVAYNSVWLIPAVERVIKAIKTGVEYPISMHVLYLIEQTAAE